MSELLTQRSFGEDTNRANPLNVSRAEDFPEEILDRILFFVANDSYHSSGGVVNKEGLCSCSLTCRYWSQRTMPALFDTIGLRSPEDVKAPRSLVTASHRKIAPHIRALHIVQSNDGVHPPWIHQVLLNTGHMFPNLCEMVYSDAETRPKIHPHPLLPTRLPVFFGSVSGLKDLWLLDQHFHSFADLMHLLNRLPLLETLSCGRLTWTHQPHRMPASRGRNPNRLSTVHLLSSKAIWPIAWLFTAPAASPRTFNEHPRDMYAPFLTLDEETAAVINDVIQCFLSHEKMCSSTFRLERANKSMWYLKCQESSVKRLPDESRLKEPCAPDIAFQLARANEHPSDEKPPRPQLVHARLQSITFSKFRDTST